MEWNIKIRTIALLTCIVAITAIESIFLILILSLFVTIWLCHSKFLTGPDLTRKILKFSPILLFVFLTFVLSNGLPISADIVNFASLIICRIFLSFLIIQLIISGKTVLEFIDILSQIGVSYKIVSILYLTNRYIYVFKNDFESQKYALKSKGFIFGSGIKSVKNVGYVIGGLFIKANDKSHAIHNAMKSRGFSKYQSSLRLANINKINILDIARTAVLISLMITIVLIDKKLL